MSSDACSSRLDQVLQALLQLQVSVEGLRGQVATMIQVTSDHEERLRHVERFQHTLTPTLATITFILGAVSKIALDRVF